MRNQLYPHVIKLVTGEIWQRCQRDREMFHVEQSRALQAVITKLGGETLISEPAPVQPMPIGLWDRVKAKVGL